MSSIKCEGAYAGVEESRFGKGSRGASDFEGTDVLKGVAILAAGAAAVAAASHYIGMGEDRQGIDDKPANETSGRIMRGSGIDNPPKNNSAESANMTVVTTPAPETQDGPYDPRADKAFVGANFKEPFYAATPGVISHYNGTENLDKNIEPLSKGMSDWLYGKFHTGVAIDDFKSMGVAEPKAHGAVQVLHELNDKYGCRYLRDHGIEPVRNKFFVWFIDEGEWNEHIKDYADKSAVGWPDLGILIRVPDYVAGMPVDPAFGSHEFAHLWGIRDRDGSGDAGDLMHSPPFSADSFGDARKIASNIDIKLNTC